MSHRKEAFSPAPAASVAGAQMGPRVLGFSNSGHRFPPGPVQPGHSIARPGRMEVRVDNKSAADLLPTPLGPVQPGP
eukprot:4208059-Amphidinium_carterae.1